MVFFSAKIGKNVWIRANFLILIFFANFSLMKYYLRSRKKCELPLLVRHRLLELYLTQVELIRRMREEKLSSLNRINTNFSPKTIFWCLSKLTFFFFNLSIIGMFDQLVRCNVLLFLKPFMNRWRGIIVFILE